MRHVPLHPGTHLTHRKALEKLRDAWVCATPPKRAQIVNDILYELEAFGEVYQSQVEYIAQHSLANEDYSI
jgi:hypothetical protein